MEPDSPEYKYKLLITLNINNYFYFMYLATILFFIHKLTLNIVVTIQILLKYYTESF